MTEQDDMSLDEQIELAARNLEPGEMIVIESRVEDGERRIDVRTVEEPNVEADE